jgi:hypothetical protein
VISVEGSLFQTGLLGSPPTITEAKEKGGGNGGQRREKKTAGAPQLSDSENSPNGVSHSGPNSATRLPPKSADPDFFSRGEDPFLRARALGIMPSSLSSSASQLPPSIMTVPTVTVDGEKEGGGSDHAKSERHKWQTHQGTTKRAQQQIIGRNAASGISDTHIVSTALPKNRRDNQKALRTLGVDPSQIKLMNILGIDSIPSISEVGLEDDTGSKAKKSARFGSGGKRDKKSVRVPVRRQEDLNTPSTPPQSSSPTSTSSGKLPASMPGQGGGSGSGKEDT